MEAHISIERYSRFLPGRFWWRVEVPYEGAREGLASTEARARAKAERAARKLASKSVAEYTLPLDTEA